MHVTCPQCQAKMKVREEYAGRQMKCPRCSTIVAMPETLSGERSSRPSESPASTETRPCPECGKQILASARICRFCKAELHGEKKKNKKSAFASKYKPCPKCGGKGPEKVKWTPWGSFYFTAMLSHVRCRQCGFGYNGKTGRSNLIAAIGLLLIPLAAIGGLVAWIATIFRDRGWLDF